MKLLISDNLDFLETSSISNISNMLQGYPKFIHLLLSVKMSQNILKSCFFYESVHYTEHITPTKKRFGGTGEISLFIPKAVPLKPWPSIL